LFEMFVGSTCCHPVLLQQKNSWLSWWWRW